MKKLPPLGPPPKASSKVVTKVMKSNKKKDTKPEQSLRKALREEGLGGYRLNWENAPGRPDITYPGKKLAIFVHGCFWHRCPNCDYPLPKTHTDFWELKFERNKERDMRKRSQLEEGGWGVLEFWECEIKKDAEACVDVVETQLRGL